MIIFGHKFIESESFYHILDIDSIKNTPPSSIIYLHFTQNNLDIIKHANLNGVKVALRVSTIRELIFANSLNAAYIIVPKDEAKSFQDLAENYLFDAKILVNIEHDSEIEELAILGIDGVLFSNAIIKVNS